MHKELLKIQFLKFVLSRNSFCRRGRTLSSLIAFRRRATAGTSIASTSDNKPRESVHIKVCHDPDIGELFCDLIKILL